MEQGLQAVVLAAGKSSRFKTGNTKLIEKMCGQELVLYPISLLQSMGIKTATVIGYQHERIKKVVENKFKAGVSFVEQVEQLGTGHAFLCAKNLWEKDHILVLNGDVPLLKEEILTELIYTHTNSDAAVSFITAHNGDPSSFSYGRVLKDGNSVKIVEARELTRKQLQEHCCVNAGIYLFKRSFLEDHIQTLVRNAVSNEYHITDFVKIASEHGHTVSTVNAPFDLVRGINTFQELWAAEQVKRAELIKYWMEKGVRFSVAQNVHIDLDVEIGNGTFIGCGAHLFRGTRIGKNCTINAFCLIENSTIQDNAKVDTHCVIKDSYIAQDAQVGPFAHIRDESMIGTASTIGNFVEVKKSTIGAQTKAKHLSYLGDANVGNKVNIGAGTITCNHTGSSKEKTTIKDQAYIGSNNSLVAPVTIGEKAFTGAGSTITKDVPADSLALGRARQVTKEGYMKTKQKEDDTATQTHAGDTDTREPLSFFGAIKSDGEREIE